MGILYIETGSNARPSRVFYDRAHSSIATISPDCIDWEETFQDAQWFHWSGITPALSKNAAILCKKAIETTDKMGLAIS